jgi:hypothetical protein
MIGILSGPQAAASAVAHASIMAVLASAPSRTWPLLIRCTTVAMVSSSLTSTALTARMAPCARATRTISAAARQMAVFLKAVGLGL